MSPLPSPIDAFPTPTSQSQAETEAILFKHLPNGSPQPLQKTQHMQFLIRNLVQGFPARYTSQDASQPWLLFWIVQAFSALQVELDPGNKQRVIDKIMAWQHPDGGFGGGPGQAAHLLPTYAAVCTLAIVGRPGERGGWDQIDRKKMYAFFMSLKQPDGSFLVTHHAEVDVRGVYCLLVTATLLDLLTPALIAGTPAFVASCQTYEGGFASASQPYFSPASPPILLDTPRPPLGEAHGGYTFCALASWVLLQPFVNSMPQKPEINTKNLLRWLVQMQGSEAELGGFKGRTNKLVDGCYSWWVGGSFALLEALGVHVSADVDVEPHVGGGEEDEWDDIDETLWNRKALQEYIIYAGQHPAGGLRDKPPKGADAYHTLYCLAGLSAAQHRVVPSSAKQALFLDAWDSSPSSLAAGTDIGSDAVSQSGPSSNSLRKACFTEALCWMEEEGGSRVVGGSANRVNATHPVFNITMTHAEGAMAYFYGKSIPAKVKGTPVKS